MNATQSKVLETIQKLLSLSDPTRGATPEEAALAMGKAKELMAKYQIEEIDLATAAGQQSSSPSFSIVKDEFNVGREQCDYDSNISRILAECFGVKIIWSYKVARSTRSNNYINHLVYLIFGDQMDVAMAKMAIPLLRDVMMFGVRALLKKRGEKWTAYVGRAFYDGVTNGYIHESEQGRARACHQAKKANADAYAIVLVDKAKAVCAFYDKYVEGLEGGLRFSRDRGRSGREADAYNQGLQTGRNLDLSGNKLK